MIFHPKIKTIIQYADQELTEPKMDSIKRHIDMCTQCREKLSMVKNIGTVRQPKKTISPNFKSQVVNHLPAPKWDTQPIVAELKSIIGEVIVYRRTESEGRVGFPGMGLKKGETVKLNGDSLALIELNDGSCLWLNRRTELQFTFAAQELSLHAGELFGIFKPQPKVFEILTPTAVLGVIGTEFDAEVKNGSKTNLRVIKGKVSVTTETSKVIVKKKQEVEAEKYTLSQPKRIKDKEHVMQWTKPLTPKPQRGRAIIKFLVFLLIGFIAVTGVVFYFKSKEKPVEPGMARKVVTLDKKDPLVLHSPYTQQGAVWRIFTTSQVKKGERWIDDLKMTVRSELMEYTEKEGARVVLTIDDCTASGGKDEIATAPLMVGRKFVYQISPEGHIVNTEVYDGKPLEYLEIVYYVNAISSDMSGMYVKKSIVPGDQWTESYAGPIPGYADSYIKVNIAYTFAGYEKRDGVEVGVIQSNVNGSLGGGLPLQKVVDQAGTHYILADNINFESKSEIIVDVITGRVVSGTSTSTTSGQKLTMVSYPKGTTQSVSKPLPSQPAGVGRGFATIEYQQ
ncbi:MAG: FecR domain-containing protein [bacterium]